MEQRAEPVVSAVLRRRRDAYAPYGENLLVEWTEWGLNFYEGESAFSLAFF